jgi:hypothetical protein
VGLSRHRIRNEVDSGRWQRLAPGVYGFGGRADSWLRRLWIAHLHAGPHSAISSEAGAKLCGVGPIDGWPLDLIVERNQARPLPGVRWHRVADLAPDHVTTCRGLPVTVPARSIFDLAHQVSAARLATIIEAAEVDGRCRLVDVATMLDSLRGPGKRGVRKLCDVLDSLGPGEALPRSELERLLDHVIALTGLPAPQREYPLPTTTDLSGFVDRCWPEAALIVEADGRRWHTRRAQIARDHDRDLEAARRGVQTQRLVWERLRGDPEGTAAALVDIYQVRLKR